MRSLSRLTSQPVCDLPPPGVAAHLEYPGNPSAVSSIRRPVASSIAGRAGTARQRYRDLYNAFLLSDNQPAIAAFIETGLRADLVYLDPPYGTGSGFQSRGLIHAYEDELGGARYVESLRRRLVLLRECMATDASIYVHIGHQMVGHLKGRCGRGLRLFKFPEFDHKTKSAVARTQLEIHMLIYMILSYFIPNRRVTRNAPGEKPTRREWIEKEYPWLDSKGRYKLVPVHTPRVKERRNRCLGGGMLPPPGKHW